MDMLKKARGIQRVWQSYPTHRKSVWRFAFLLCPCSCIVVYVLNPIHSNVCDKKYIVNPKPEVTPRESPEMGCIPEKFIGALWHLLGPTSPRNLFGEHVTQDPHLVRLSRKTQRFVKTASEFNEIWITAISSPQILHISRLWPRLNSVKSVDPEAAEHFRHEKMLLLSAELRLISIWLSLVWLLVKIRVKNEIRFILIYAPSMDHISKWCVFLVSSLYVSQSWENKTNNNARIGWSQQFRQSVMVDDAGKQ